MSAGRRRSTRKSKKSKKGGKSRRHRKVRGGGYGFKGALDGSTNGAEWGSSNTSTPYSSSTGGPIPDPFGTAGQSGSSRRRRSRRVKRRTMKGGANYNVAGVGYGFSNPISGVHGIAPATGYPARVGGAPDGAIAGVKAA
jgi:hypothetical protein